MNTFLIKSVPQGDFREVSTLMNGWQAKLQVLVSQQQLIRYDMYPLLGIPPEILNDLDRRGYMDHVLENDQWQHFLVPRLN